MLRSGWGEAGAGPASKRSGEAPLGGKREGGERPLPGGTGRQCKQAQEVGATLGKSRKLGHVADALGKGDDGGAASEQVCKPLRGLKASVIVVEGEKDPGAAPEG